MKKLKPLFLSLLSLLIMTSQVYAKSNNMNLTDSTKEYILENGLKVLIKEDHTAPIYTQALFYKVGSRNDLEGQTGIAHYLEHMQFNGTKTRPKGAISEEIEKRGGSFNAATSTDFTMYYMTLPAEGNLDFSLELEADRMRNSILNTEEAEREKRVVLAELAGGENNSMTLLFRDVLKAAYPEHPYGRPIIGWKKDVENITAENLREYYDTYYQPNNAVLILVGDLNTEEVLEKVKNTLGKIPASNKPIPQIEALKNKPAKQIVEVQSPSQSSLITFVWNAVSFKDKDYVPLSVLSAILTNGSLSRLEKALVDTGKASYVGSSMRQGIDPFSFYILAGTSNDGDLKEIQRIIQSEIEEIQKNGISEEELKRVKAKAETSFLFGLEDSAGMASQLGFFELLAGDWKKTFTWSQEIEAVNIDQVKKVANKYLKPENLVIGTLINDHSGKAPIAPAFAGNHEIAHYKAPSASEVPVAKGIKAETIVFKNGLKIILRPNSNNPVIAIAGTIDAGEVFDEDLIGVSTVTGLMLERGNAKYERDEFNIAIENIGAEIEISPEKDFVSVSAKARSKDYDQLLELLALSLIKPSFDQEELDKLKMQILLDLKQSQDDLNALGKIAIYQNLFPKTHPYYEPNLAAQMESVQKLKVEDLKNFHKKFYGPKRTILSISGDFEKKEILDSLNKHFENWSSKQAGDKFQVATIPISEPKQIQAIEVPGKSQALIIMGHNGEVNRSHPDFYALLVANDILGGGSTLSSRLGTKVREEAGLVYTIRSAMSMSRGAGPFLIQMGVSPDKVNKAIELTKAELQRFYEGNITDQELERAKNYRRGYFISNNLTSNENIALSLSQYALWGLDLNTINEYPEIIKKLTKEDIVRVSQKYLSPDKLQIVVLKPKK